jgi:Diiron non-heme beta-hydroxylase N-terminal domain/Beta-lactamase superfamily domain
VTERQLILRPNVRTEPLINKWYVNMPMFAPHSFSMLTKNVHIKLLQSYLLDPRSHFDAAQDPSLLGSPFVNIDEKHVDRVRQFLDTTRSELRLSIEFANAIEELDKHLRQNAKGHGLLELYGKVPEALRGFVELVYDLDDHPSIRFIEGLMYRSDLYQERLQTISLSPAIHKPAFVMSTPRIVGSDSLELVRPFRSESLDILFQSRTKPAKSSVLSSALDLDVDHPKCQPFFEPVKEDWNAHDHRAVQVGVSYLGHGCLLFESELQTLLTDPLIGYESGFGSTHGATFSDLPDKIDYVLITHAHLDHLVLETLLQLRHKIGCIVLPKSGKGSREEPSVKMMLRNFGFSMSIVELEELEAIPTPEGEIRAIPFVGEHHDLDICGKTAYRLSISGRSYFIGADLNNVERAIYEKVRDVIGATQTIFIGMESDGAPLNWFYGHLFTRPLDRNKVLSRPGSGCDAKQAQDLVFTLGARNVYVYAMGLELAFQHVLAIDPDPTSRRLREVGKFLGWCRTSGINAELLRETRRLSSKGQL